MQWHSTVSAPERSCCHSTLGNLCQASKQVYSSLHLWRGQHDQLRTFVQRSRQHTWPSSAKLSGAEYKTSKRLITFNSSALGEQSLCAGIPVSSANTTAGHSLWQTLQQNQLDFVPAVQRCLLDISREGVQQQDILASSRRKALLEDILYLWAVAEAYLADAGLQDSFRKALGRQGTALLAQGADGVKLLSEVKLLDEQEGQYMIGSVQFVKPGKAAAQLDQHPGIRFGPSLDAVLGSERGKALLESQGKAPSRMSREGAARTYHMYTYWGYFNRRMAARRQLEQQAMPGSQEASGAAYTFGDGSRQQKSYYGEMTNVWRYFENVPDAISELRTKEAAQVADKHLRALFGEQQECVTTLLAWQQMLNEAKWFGRALYDAEEFLMKTCAHHMTEQ